MLPHDLMLTTRAEEKTDKGSSSRHGVPSIVLFLIVVIIFLIIGVIAWIITSQLRARRLGLPRPPLTSYIPFYKGSSSSREYPSSGSNGVVGWVTDKFNSIKDRRSRTAGGAYEEPLNNVGRGRRPNRAGFGALDPDEAWDARVGTEADAYGPGGYYEEQEVGLHGPGAGPYGGSGYGGPAEAAAGVSHAELPAYGDEDGGRGRSRSRDPAFIGGTQAGLDDRFDEEMGRKSTRNPFSDQAERSDMGLRGVSPRPMDGDGGRSKP
ncbi:MAG: hypothetical protein M1817_002709 [Caeruleum heppii]|nr:MAG: hypothetical protein M1817_002709 [Caeruleum heppii]